MVGRGDTGGPAGHSVPGGLPARGKRGLRDARGEGVPGAMELERVQFYLDLFQSMYGCWRPEETGAAQPSFQVAGRGEHGLRGWRPPWG